MGSSGSSIESLAALAKAPEALGSVLDFLMMDDNWVLAYAAYDGSDPFGHAAHAWRYLVVTSTIGPERLGLIDR